MIKQQMAVRHQPVYFVGIVVNRFHFHILFLFDGFWGMCGDHLCNVFPLLFTVLWVSIFSMLWMRAEMMIWHASMFLGLRPVGDFPDPFSICLISRGFLCFS
jgi:hypothetical protein